MQIYPEFKKYLQVLKQKQPFANVLQNRCSEEFHNIHRKTPMLESLFNNVADLKACGFIKKRLQHRCFLVNIPRFLRTAFFYRARLVAASV